MEVLEFESMLDSHSCFLNISKFHLKRRYKLSNLNHKEIDDKDLKHQLDIQNITNSYEIVKNELNNVQKELEEFKEEAKKQITELVYEIEELKATKEYEIDSFLNHHLQDNDDITK